MAKRHHRKMSGMRRNAIVLNDEDEIFDDQVSATPLKPSGSEAAAAAAAAAAAGQGKHQADSSSRSRNPRTKTDEDRPSSDDDNDEEEALPATVSSKTRHVRIGRRTTEDEAGDIPTQFLVVAKIDPSRDNNLTWLSVATWQLNGLRIGSVESGDPIREDDEVFGFSTGLDPDPYFFARNVTSVERIREHLLQRIEEDGAIEVVPETMSDKAAQSERNDAVWTRLAEEYPDVAADEGMRLVGGQDARQRFPHPWALPVAPTKSRSGVKFSSGGARSSTSKGRSRTRKNSTARKPIPGLPAFDSVGSEADATSINIVATFVNKLDDRNLRLKHFIQADFDINESLASAKKYFLKGDGVDYAGLKSNHHLSRKHWLLELWVIPQVEGCSTLFKWDDVSELPARGFCDEKALEKGDGELKLYVEVRIVRDPEHANEETQESEEDGE